MQVRCRHLDLVTGRQAFVNMSISVSDGGRVGLVSRPLNPRCEGSRSDGRMEHDGRRTGTTRARSTSAKPPIPCCAVSCGLMTQRNLLMKPALSRCRSPLWSYIIGLGSCVVRNLQLSRPQTDRWNVR
jgi:hypothetical protein